MAFACAVCMAATGGAVAWDKLHPWLNPLDLALSEALHVPANTEQSNGVVGRLLQSSAQIEAALRSMEARGDARAGYARSELHHRHAMRSEEPVTVQQIRARLQGMQSDEAFLAWLKQAIR